MVREKILEEIIEGYRNSIYQRYQYQNIKDKYEIPETINEQTVNLLRNYFLTYMYPEYTRRAELDDAFASLDNYIKNPRVLLGLLLEAAKLIFRYGRHLPKILNSGLNAMKTFKVATSFENNLVEEAINTKIDPPYNLAKIDQLIKLLAREEIERFITASQSLFEVLQDRVLMTKIKEIIQYLINTMKSKEATYATSQIKGLQIGLDMLTEGDNLFVQLTKEDQQNLINLIAEIERDNLDHIF